jgi:hypothetical protein
METAMAQRPPIKFPAPGQQYMLGQPGCAHDTQPMTRRAGHPERFCCDAMCTQGRDCPAVREQQAEQRIVEQEQNVFLLRLVVATAAIGALLVALANYAVRVLA